MAEPSTFTVDIFDRLPLFRIERIFIYERILRFIWRISSFFLPKKIKSFLDTEKMWIFLLWHLLLRCLITCTLAPVQRHRKDNRRTYFVERGCLLCNGKKRKVVLFQIFFPIGRTKAAQIFDLFCSVELIKYNDRVQNKRRCPIEIEQYHWHCRCHFTINRWHS